MTGRGLFFHLESPSWPSRSGRAAVGPGEEAPGCRRAGVTVAVCGRLRHRRARAPSRPPAFPAISAGPAGSGRWHRTRPCRPLAVGASLRCPCSSPSPVLWATWCCAAASAGWEGGASCPWPPFCGCQSSPLVPQGLFVLWAAAGKEELRQNSEILGLKIYFISVCALQTTQTMHVLPSLHCGLLTDPLFPFLWAEGPWGSTFWREPMEAHHSVTLGWPEERFLPETPLLVSYHMWWHLALTLEVWLLPRACPCGIGSLAVSWGSGSGPQLLHR